VRTLAHLSDLHFGQVDPAALEPLRRRLVELSPDLVVISGDLTQRARAREFREARAYLDSLPKPQVVVAGNHDVPLYNPFARFLRPLSGYRRFVCADVEPGFVDEEIAVLGVNTARSFVFKGGRVSEAQLARVRNELGRLEGVRIRILVSHHPVTALEKLAHCGVDLFVCGHHHATRADRCRTEGCAALVVQAGTATSRRTREESNGFNLLRIRPQRIEVEHYALYGGSFARRRTETFSRDAAGWKRDGPQ
jgi:predicted MPP superfamily phosphohydrolase